MIVNLPGFPNEVSHPIDLPDIGELLMYPAFQNICADDFFRYASAFQKFLLDKVPLRHDRRYVVIRSGVWLLEPNTRSHVNRDGGWHIDGNSDNDHVIPDERIFILSSPCSALTEFNLHPLEIESAPNETRSMLTRRIRQAPEAFGIVARQIQPGRVYTFQNHLHRAVDPSRVEFRYFLRVRETNEPVAYVRKPLNGVELKYVSTQTANTHIIYHRDRIVIMRPRCLKDDGVWA